MSSKFLTSFVSLIGLLSALVCANLMAGNDLQDVKALVYSSTAAEIMWSRENSETVQVRYNGLVVATEASDSYFTDELDPAESHQFDVRILRSAGDVSAPTLLSFDTANFQPPTKVVYPPDSSLALTETMQLSQVKLIAYSETASEIFWNRQDHPQVRVEVIHNQKSLGVFDTSSVFLTNLELGVDHQFQIRPLVDGLPTGESYSIYYGGETFLGRSTEILASRQFNVDSLQLPSGDNRASDDEPESGLPAAENENNEPVTDTPARTIEANLAGPGGLGEGQTATPPPSQNDDPSDGSSIVPVKNGDCVVRSIGDLSDCINAVQGIDRINVQSDIRCSSGNCCPAGGALLRLNNVSDLTIEGNGFRLLRQDGQRQCSLMDVSQSKDIVVNNWMLDDDVRDSACLVADKCPRMLHLRTSSNLMFDQVTVSNGKGYAIYVQQVNGFTFRQSTLENSGVLGMYLGHSDKSSTNITIEHSTFVDNQTNALALLGVTGSSTSTNTISNNVFRRNHWRGQWQVAPRFGTGFTGGGQLYIAQASGVTIKDNLIADGFCENCFVQRRMGTGVSGIELAIPGMNTVNNIVIEGNVVDNHDAWGIFVNQGSALNSSIIIRENTLTDNSIGLKPSDARASGNIINDR